MKVQLWLLIMLLCIGIGYAAETSSSSISWISTGFYYQDACRQGGNCTLSNLYTDNLYSVNSTITNYNITGEICLNGICYTSWEGVFNTTNYYTSTVANSTYLKLDTTNSPLTGNLTIQKAVGDVELRLQSEVNKHSFFYLMESANLGFRLWYDGSGDNIFKFDAVDGLGVYAPQMWFDRDTLDIDFFATVDMNVNNLSNVKCLELDDKQICSFDEINGSSEYWTNATGSFYPLVENPSGYLQNGTDKTVYFGNVGIGTTTPNVALDVKGSINASGTGFFGWLGNLTNRISKLWATDIDVSGTATIVNLNVTNIISNVNMTSKNITNVGCIIYNSGGMDCSGV